jgi:hypothetical protein
LQKVKIFGEKKEANPINAIIAVVAAFYVIAYTPVGMKIGEFFASFFTQTTLALVSLVCASLILGIAGKDILWTPKKWYEKFLVTLILALIGVVIFFTSGGPEFFGFPRAAMPLGLTTDDIFFLFLMGITLAIVIGIPLAGREKEEQPR